MDLALRLVTCKPKLKISTIPWRIIAATECLAYLYIDCVSALPRAGYTLYGTQYGSQCYGENDLASATSLGALPQSECNMPCAGLASIMCGGSWANSLYALSKFICRCH